MAKRKQKNLSLLPETIEKIKVISETTLLPDGAVVDMAISDTFDEMKRRIASGIKLGLVLPQAAAGELNGGEQ
jgi:hypothetical protein